VFTSQEVQQTDDSLPSFFVRWFIFFRLYPRFLKPHYLFRILFMSWRHPVLWNTVMKAEKQRIARKKEEYLNNSI
jgi:hypothetical protein